MARRRRPQKRKKGSTTETAAVLPPPLPESDDEDDHDGVPIPSAPPLGPASQRVLFWDETSVSNGSTHGTDDGEHSASNGKSQRKSSRLLNGRSKRSLPNNGAGWERLRLSLSPSSYRGSFNNLQSMYQSVVDRSFSIIIQSEEGSVFWSTLLQGFSVLPLFMLVATACSNTAFGILFTAVGDVPHLQGWADWARLGLSTIGTMIALRNFLVSMYDLVLDSTAQYPLLNPGLLSRLRSIVAVRPHGLQRLIAVLHLTSCTTLYGLTLLGIQQGNLPNVWLNRCHIFGVNTAIKLATWWLYEFYEEGAKAAAAKGVGRPTPSLGPRHGSGRHLQLLRRVRKVIIYYVATSDVLLLLILVGNYLTRGEGRELLLLEQDAHHDELERRVVAFNSLALVLTNLAAFGQFTFEALTYGAHLLDRTTWTASIAHSRQASLGFTGLAYLVSMHRHGYLPSFFTLLVVFNGLSLSKVTLWACIEVQRTLLPLWEILRKHPGGVLLVLLTYAGATRTPSDALLVTLFVTSAFWAWQIQVRLHYVDVWAFGLTGLAVFMALHQAWHHGDRHLQPATGDLGQDDGIFRVQLSETHLNITSGLGPKSIVLRPFPSTTSSSPPSSASYPFCELNLHGLSLLDYAGLCFLAYLKRDSPAFATFFAAAFDPAEWEVKHAPSPRAQGAVFVDMFNRRLNTSVIAIRGTNPTNLFDVFQDMIMFNGAFCWDVLAMFVPLVAWLPAMWTANLLYLSYLPLKLKFNTMPAYRELSLHYHREIQSYVEHIHDRKVVLTGHSLGGGIGKVVAARLLLPIIAISAPGIALSHKLFDVPRENLDRFEVNLISGEDLVPKVDRSNGLIMKMRCTKSNPLSCHELGYTLSELHDKCGLPFWVERHRR